MEKMAIIKKSKGEEEICYILDEVMQINKKNSELVHAFSELVKLNNKLNNLDEEYAFSIYKNDCSDSVEFFNQVLNGENRAIENGDFASFFFEYINKYFPKYKDVVGLDLLKKANLILLENKKKR